MDKDNVFRSSSFFMDEGDVLNMILKDITGDYITVGLYGEEDSYTIAEAYVNLNEPDLTDMDGNIYTTVIIGNQEWIVENYRTTTYADGTAIPNLTADVDWEAEDGTAGHNGAYCVYDNNEANRAVYGCLYNGYAVFNSKEFVYLERYGVKEVGWRIPTEGDFGKLIIGVGGINYSGNHLKEAGIAHWADDYGQDNSFGFTALPGGYRHFNGVFWDITYYAGFISSTFMSATNRTVLSIATENASLTYSVKSGHGMSVRLVRDI